MKEKLFSVTLKDCRVDTFRGSGKGGQKRNKTSSGVRITHIASGAVGQSDDTRSQHKNKSIAFKRMVNTPKFQKWLRIEVAKRNGELQKIEEKVNEMMKNETMIEVRENGKWVRYK